MEEESAQQSLVNEETIIDWQGPDRPFRKRGTQFYFNVAAITVVIFLVLFFFIQYALIAVLFALVFVGIVSNTVPPQMIIYKITTKGIYRDEEFAAWEELTEFYSDTIYNHKVILFTRPKKFPPQFVVMPEIAKVDAIMTAIKKYVTEKEPPQKGWYENRADDLTKLINLGQDSK